MADDGAAPGARRAIRSYVLRQGRMSPAQQRACDELLPRYGVAPSARVPLDFAEVFGRGAPVVLEIGSGMGETTVAIATAQPGTDFLAVEVHLPGVGALLRRIDASALTNVRVLRQDAVDVVTTMIAPGSLAGIHVFFPDPWPKKRHHKRRLIQPALVALLADRLKDGGALHLATDWEPYAAQMLETLSAEPRLRNVAAEGGFVPRSSDRSPTRFERRGERLGHQVWDLEFSRV